LSHRRGRGCCAWSQSLIAAHSVRSSNDALHGTRAVAIAELGQSAAAVSDLVEAALVLSSVLHNTVSRAA